MVMWYLVIMYVSKERCDSMMIMRMSEGGYDCTMYVMRCEVICYSDLCVYMMIAILMYNSMVVMFSICYFEEDPVVLFFVRFRMCFG
jgi:hypothetical protein